ncbi:MAG: TetR/AcrR family transcriptional regulator [Solirubrobacterales bacterium]
MGEGSTTTSADLSTKEQLVQTVLELAKEQPRDEIRVEKVLEESGISTGSLYHHFDDFGHLIETAMAERYVEILRPGLILLEAALDEADDLDDLRKRIYAGGLAYAKLNTPEARFERARILARAGKSERLMEILGEQQLELTDAYEEMFRRAQHPDGWLNPDLDSKAMAVFIQAYTFGRLVDDITSDRMEQEKWMELTFAVFIRTFVRDPKAAGS